MNGEMLLHHRDLFTEHVDHNFIPTPAPTSSAASLATDTELNAMLAAGDHKKLKLFLRDQAWPVNHDIRKVLWSTLCKHCYKDSGSIYQEMLDSLFGHGHDDSHQVSLPSFVDPSFMCHYHLNNRGVHVVKKIICIIGQTNPDITFSPSLFATASLFLHYMSDEDCFNCVYGLVRNTKGDFLTQTKLSYEASALVLRDLAKKYARSTYSYICKQTNESDQPPWTHWMWWILRDLPFAYLVRIMDCYLFEGMKVFYRIALAILILYNKHVGKHRRRRRVLSPLISCVAFPVKQSPQRKPTLGISSSISQFCEEIPVTREKLFKVAFRNLRGFTKKEIHKLQVKNEMYLNSVRHLQVPHLTKSASCESLDLKVSKSASEINDVHSVCVPSGSLLSHDQWQMLWQWVPTRMTVYQPTLLYTTQEHGTSIKTLYSRCEESEPIIIIIQTSNGEKFGAYLSMSLSCRRKRDKLSFFGTGETFLFSFQPRLVKYDWVGVGCKQDVTAKQNLFIAGDHNVLMIGGGDGVAIRLDEELRHGESDTSATFNNEPLCSSTQFLCSTVEVFGLQ
ncbi:GTPase-activating protein skywalker-like isoform X1 [Tubulanus polymorphus]|uniref:GTPase-activating protein skywalker-like isoform X1 n=1 Tax=Tubulanus polymorphus TaxID=672921 RepID=UPI003DA25D39